MLLEPVWISCGLLILAGCAQHYPSRCAQEHAGVPIRLANELKADVTQLADKIGERNCYRPENLEKSAVWLETRFRELGYVPRRQPVSVPAGKPFECGPMTVWNIEVEKMGVERPDEVLVVGAHYDSKVATEKWTGHGKVLPEQPGTPGANDNASGLSAVLAMARYFADVPTRRTIRFVAFVNEEPPFFLTEAMGSRVYAKALAADSSVRVIGAITPDLIGCYTKQESGKRLPFGALFGLPDRADYLAFASNMDSKDFARNGARIFSNHSRLDARAMALPTPFKFVAWSDDWSFWQEGIPAFAVTDTAFMRYPHYHEITDTPDQLDYEKMADVVWGLTLMVEELANSK